MRSAALSCALKAIHIVDEGAGNGSDLGSIGGSWHIKTPPALPPPTAPQNTTTMSNPNICLRPAFKTLTKQMQLPEPQELR